MVGLDILAALDGIQWLRSGEEVARRLAISQPTVTRYCSKALRTFDLQIERRDGEWELVGDPTILQMERQVHQMARWQGQRRLRLEATYWSAATYCAGLPPEWMLGSSNIVGVSRNLQLVRDRIVDGWIAGLPDVPDADDPEFCCTVLTRMPVFFTCAANHPLLEKQDLGYGDLAEYPTLALPPGSYPRVEGALRAMGLWNDTVRMNRYRRDKWEGRTEEELVIGYGTPLSLRVSGQAIRRLPLLLPFHSGDALVIRRAWADHPRVTALLDHLRRAIQPLAADDPEIEMA